MSRIATLPTLAALAGLLVATPLLAHVDVPGLDVNGQCVGDANGDHTVAINENILAINNALGGCPELPVTLQFKGVVGDQPFACGTAYSGIGTGNSQFIPADFRLYVSNVRLLSASGEEVPVALEQDNVWQYQNVAMLDFEDGSGPCGNGNQALNTSVRGTVPAGVYTGARFDLGLPFDLDHGNASTAPSPLNFTAMFWSWQYGYKFLRVDTADDKFRVHLGSIGCDAPSPSRPPTSCTNPNVATVTLNNFNPQHDIVLADLAALLAGNNIDSNQPETAPGCQSDAGDSDCVPVFANLGLDFATGAPLATQSFFRAGAADDAGHVEFKIAGNAASGGTLIAHPEFDTAQPIPLFFDQCFGGTGAECEGGTRLFSAANPGIEPIDASVPEESLYTLADGTPISLEVVAIDAGLSFKLGDTTLDSAGDAVTLGTSPGFHADLEAQIVQDGGQEPHGTFSVTFKLTTTSAAYQGSETFTVLFTPKDK